jgi:formamidase
MLPLAAPLVADETVVIGGEGDSCLTDPGCINRLHPAIPPAARARPGQMMLFRTRDASDFLGTVEAQSDTPPTARDDLSRVHPMTGPVYIEGAEAGDVLKVTLQRIEPGRWAYTFGGSGGFIGDRISGEMMATWRLTETFATSEDIPGVRIPNASFPGVVTTLPGPDAHARMLAREQALAEAGGTVLLPDPENAKPAEICGPQGTAADSCLRTIPPREHGGNMDIRYLKTGVSIYLPCYIDGCGLAIGDLHYAQGDGEVSGTAIEMSANVWATAEIIKDGPDLRRGPHYEGHARLLDIPSRRFYAVTGFPLKDSDTVPPDMEYLESDRVAALENLSNDINLAARNAVEGIVEYLVSSRGFTRQQAYIISSVAVDLRIGQLVDVPNYGVTAILPLDIFE